MAQKRKTSKVNWEEITQKTGEAYEEILPQITALEVEKDLKFLVIKMSYPAYIIIDVGYQREKDLLDLGAILGKVCEKYGLKTMYSGSTDLMPGYIYSHRYKISLNYSEFERNENA